MARSFIVRRKVYRGAYHVLPRRTAVRIIDAVVPTYYSKPAQPRARPATQKQKKRPPVTQIKRARAYRYFTELAGASSFGAVEQAATSGNRRRLTAVRVVLASKARRAAFPLKPVSRKRLTGSTAFLFPGTVDALPSLRLGARRQLARQQVTNAVRRNAAWGLPQHRRMRMGVGVYDFSPTDFTPVYWHPWWNQKKAKQRLVGTLVRDRRANWNPAVRANKRQLAQAYDYSLTEQATSWASPFLVENTRRRRTARMVCRMKADRKAWPRQVTAKLMLVEPADASTHATGAPGLLAPGRKFWRNRWKLGRPIQRRQRRDFRLRFQVATPFTFEGALLGTLRVQPTYILDDMLVGPTYEGSIGTNLEGLD